MTAPKPSSASSAPTILWLRKDLRLADNHALTASAAAGPVIPVFILDDVFETTLGAAAKLRLKLSLEALSRDLAEAGAPLILRRGDALTVLRETVMGRELFDHAFREYSRRWKFKRPTPSDFFRTMEDASGVDLDWFWRGWFYTTDHVDVGVASVREYKVFTGDPDIDNPIKRAENALKEPEPLQQSRNRAEGIELYVDGFDNLKDVYNENDRFTTTNKDRNSYQSYLKGLTPWQKRALERAIKEDQFIYFVDYENKGGLVTPLPVTLHFADGTFEDMMVPAEIWRRDAEFVTQMYIRDKQITSVEVDKHHQIADADHRNNSFPQKVSSSRLKLFKSNRKARDLMADLLVKLKTKKNAVQLSEGEKAVPLAASE